MVGFRWREVQQRGWGLLSRAFSFSGKQQHAERWCCRRATGIGKQQRQRVEKIFRGLDTKESIPRSTRGRRFAELVTPLLSSSFVLPSPAPTFAFAMPRSSGNWGNWDRTAPMPRKGRDAPMRTTINLRVGRVAECDPGRLLTNNQLERGKDGKPLGGVMRHKDGHQYVRCRSLGCPARSGPTKGSTGARASAGSRVFWPGRIHQGPELDSLCGGLRR